MYQTMMSDSPLNDYRITACSRQGNMLHYELQPRRAGKAMYNRMEMDIEAGTGVFRRMHVMVNRAYSREVESYTLHILKREQLAADGSWRKVRNKVLGNKEQLKERYQGYRYRDLRDKGDRKVN